MFPNEVIVNFNTSQTIKWVPFFDIQVFLVLTHWNIQLLYRILLQEKLCNPAHPGRGRDCAGLVVSRIIERQELKWNI